MGPETNPSSCESTGKARTRLTRYNRMISSHAYYTEEGILTCPQSSLSLLLMLGTFSTDGHRRSPTVLWTATLKVGYGDLDRAGTGNTRRRPRESPRKLK